MAVVAYIDNILIPPKGVLEKHHQQVSKVFQLLMNNHMCVEIDKCIFDSKEVAFLEYMVSGSGSKMDPNKAKAIVNWLWTNNVKEEQQLWAYCNFYRRFVPRYAAIVAPITALFRGKSKEILWQDAPEAAVLKIPVLFTSG